MPSWNIVLPDDSGDCELEEEEYGVEWPFEEISSLSSKERFYHEAYRATRLSGELSLSLSYLALQK